VGYHSVILGAARSGYRSVPLKDAIGNLLPDSSVFVRLSRKEKQNPNKKVANLEKQVKELTNANLALETRLATLERQMEIVLKAKQDKLT